MPSNSNSNMHSSRRMATAKVALSALIAALSASSGVAFHVQQPPVAFARSATARTSASSSRIHHPSPSPSALSMTLEDVNSFYTNYPIQAAVLTCGVKASLADCVAQIQSWTNSERAIEMRRNAGYIIYGGIFIGLMCHIEYDIVFPALFGTTHDLKNIASSVLFDNFVSAPLMWLPPAYLIKSVMYGNPLKEGLDKYVSDIQNEGLLLKYWAVWLPAQTISFSFVPDHMRVLFMACISFGWFIILSNCQSANDNATDAIPAAMIEQEPLVIPTTKELVAAAEALR